MFEHTTNMILNIHIQVAEDDDDPSVVVEIEHDQKHGGEMYTVQNKNDERQILHRRDNAKGTRRSMRPHRTRTSTRSGTQPLRRSKRNVSGKK